MLSPISVYLTLSLVCMFCPWYMYTTHQIYHGSVRTSEQCVLVIQYVTAMPVMCVCCTCVKLPINDTTNDDASVPL